MGLEVWIGKLRLYCALFNGAFWFTVQLGWGSMPDGCFDKSLVGFFFGPLFMPLVSPIMFEWGDRCFRIPPIRKNPST